MEREFKGIWIPAEIWLAEDLLPMEKLLLAEIDSLSSAEKPCYASNKYLAEFLKLSESTVSDYISHLKKLGYVKQVSPRSQKRLLITTKPSPCTVTPRTVDGHTNHDSLTVDGEHNNIVKDNEVNNKAVPPIAKTSESKLFSIERDKSAKGKKWIEDKRKIILAYGFTRQAQDVLADFLENLIAMDSYLPDLTIRAQLDLLKKLPEDKQIEAVAKTVSRGWKSLEYAIEDCKKQGKGKFNTAEKSNSQLRTNEERERRSAELQGQETF